MRLKMRRVLKNSWTQSTLIKHCLLSSFLVLIFLPEQNDTAVTPLGKYVKTKQFKCEHCKKHFFTFVALRKHAKICKSYFCVTCKKTFVIEANFEKHFKNCPPKRYPCTICSKSYSRKSDMEAHMRCHNNIQPKIQCRMCGAICLSSKLLTLHEEQEHLQKAVE